MVKHARRNITTVDIHKENYRLLKLMAEEGRYDVKGLLNRLLQRVLAREMSFREKYPNLSISEVKENRITLKEENARSAELIYVFYDNDELMCNKDKSKNCRHVLYAKNSEVSIVMGIKDLEKKGKQLMILA